MDENRDIETLGSPERFGHSWDKFDEILPIHEEQFRRWTPGLDRNAWQGKRFLGPLTYGAASSLSIDIDDRTLAAARRNLADFNVAEIDYRSAYDIEATDEFDIAFSIGVIHHLEDPDRALRGMYTALKPGGMMLVWLYGIENNEWIVRYFNPLRRFLFSKLPLPLVYALSFPATALLWLLLKVGIGRTEYMQMIRRFSFRHLRAIVYDHMIPRIANYYTKAEAIDLLGNAGLVDVTATWVNEMSWTVTGRKPTASAPRDDTAQACVD
jgi:SAM-dependent methyltransferase